MSSKIHTVVDTPGNPIEFSVTQGAAHERTQAEGRREGKRAHYVLGDKGDDSDAFRAYIQAQGAVPVIPGRSSRKGLPNYDQARYQHSNRVERLFNKIKPLSRIATRYEKTLASFMSRIPLSTSVILMRC